MIDFRLGRHALSICAAIAVLTGCSGSQTQTAAMPQAATNHVLTATSSGCGSQCCPALLAGSGILPDGDFSQAPEPNPSNGGTYEKGQIFAPSWIVTNNSINFYGPTYWDVDGLCSVDLDGQGSGNLAGGIRSSGFKTKKGASYGVSFFLSANGFCAPTVKTMDIKIDGQFKQYTWDTSGGNDAQNGDYLPESWAFIANGPVSKLSFVSEDPKKSGCGAVVAGIAIAHH
jgi:hypothetical protein